MIRRLVTLLGIISLTFFTACGGGGDDKAPPPMPPQATPGQKQDFNDLQAQAERMKASCTNQLTPLFMQAAAISQSPGGTQQMMQMMPMMMQQQGLPDQCKNDLMNFMMALNSIQIPGVGPYANTPQGQQYAKTQIIAVMNGIYARINQEFQARGIQLTPEQQMALQQDLLKAAQVYAVNMAPQLGPYGQPLTQAAGI